VNGDQSNNSAPFSGAAYVFAGLGVPEPAPRLDAERTGSHVRLSWPLSAIGYALEQTGTLPAAATDWSEVPGPFDNDGIVNFITLPAATDNKNAFFRLRKP
jgi:hypothetical protein